MASFEIVQREGMHWVKASLAGEELRVESGALSFLHGDIRIEASLPSLRQVMTAALADEALIRPRYVGTGEVVLEPALGGFHVLELADEEWILEAGCYWASEGSIELSFFRENVWTALWTGEGLFQFRTRVRGTGKVVVRTPGPAEEVEISDGVYRTEGRIVIGRCGDIAYKVRRPTGRWLDYFLAGEDLLRSFEGTGRLLVCATPYWRTRIQEMLRTR